MRVMIAPDVAALGGAAFAEWEGDGLRATELAGLDIVHNRERIETHAADRSIHPFRIGNVEHRIATRTALHTLVDRRKKPAAPGAFAGAGEHATGNQHDETGQI